MYRHLRDDDGPAVRLTEWFDRHARRLPWREDRTPYRVWVSETMLQQTRADTVVPYFLRFLTIFPDVRALAEAPLEAVLKAWEGLGYYRRARLLHQAARIVVDEHDGHLPAGEVELRTLPGIGPYTAAAISAFAFGRPTIAVDANVRRVGCRFLGLADPDDRAIAATFGNWLDKPPEPRNVTEALIEIGALVCTPRRPACAACPLRTGCRAAASGAPEAFPERGSRRAPPIRTAYACVHADARGVWLVERRPDGLLGGLWGFPQQDVRPPGEVLGTVTHAYSHFRLELEVVLAGDPTTARGCGAERVAWSRVPALPISKVDDRVLDLLRASGALRRGHGGAGGCDTMPP